MGCCGERDREPRQEYVLVTAARNEAEYIARTIESVLGQTVLPARWVIVSDSSTDRTDDIVAEYARVNDCVRLLRRESAGRRDFSSKVQAIGDGIRCLDGVEYVYIGILDADIVADEDYFARLLERFQADERLGLAGGAIHELDGEAYSPRSVNRDRIVPGAIQLFRRACFEDIGGFLPLPLGGEDSVAGVMARMRGWHVRSFGDLPVKHLRRTGSAGGRSLGRRFREGRMDRAMGYHPLYEVSKCLRRIGERPFVASSCVRLAGYCWASFHEEVRVPADVARFVRDEQLARLRMVRRRGRQGEVE